MSSGAKRERDASDSVGGKKQKVSQSMHDPPPGLELPDGWLDCPPFGHNIIHPDYKSGIIPCKVPLGSKFNPYVGDKTFTPKILIQRLRKKGYEVGLVIDLTNSYRYYDPGDFMKEGAQYIKIQCRGRGETPDAEAVNHFCFEVLKFKTEQQQMLQDAVGPVQPKHIVVHCTHGFNRTGFMLANWMVRYENLSAAQAVSTFASFRSPGIYKEDYLQTFFRYHHEERDPLGKGIRIPLVPDWKHEKEPEGLELTAEDLDEAEGEMKHDDDIGEPVSEEEQNYIQRTFLVLVTGREQQLGERLIFPGGQPVSLARENLGLLNTKRYMVTWKADGTRYLIMICRWGCYLMDRTFKVRRLQMRFLHPDKKTRHHLTILDGEMVVDEDLETGKQHRRFLAYDMLVLHNDTSWLRKGFEARWRQMEESVTAPRKQERIEIEKALKALKEKKPSKVPQVPYKYDQEALSVRRKGFWALPKAQDLLDDFIPKLSHECDGLILQPAEAPYKIGTCNDLLKWKFSHLNSVDFLLRISENGEKQLALLESRRSHGGGPAHMTVLPGAKIRIGKEDAERLVDTIIECSWNAEEQTWSYMRERRDKDTPNAYHVFEKVMKSIEDNIKQEDLLDAVTEALQNPIYAMDKLKMG